MYILTFEKVQANQFEIKPPEGYETAFPVLMVALGISTLAILWQFYNKSN